MRQPSRDYSPAFKAKVTLAAIKGEKTLAELSLELDIHANVIKTWRDQLLEGDAGIFDGGKPASPRRGLLLADTSTASVVSVGSIRALTGRRPY
jgi:transposase-like protein